MGKYCFSALLLGLLLLVMFLASCEKEPRRVDINDGNENPSVRKLIIEMTHRYSYVADSALPGVVISLFETEEDIMYNRYTRSDTTDAQGKLTFQNMDAGNFIVLLQHQNFGTKRELLNITNETVVSYEYYYY